MEPLHDIKIGKTILVVLVLVKQQIWNKITKTLKSEELLPKSFQPLTSQGPWTVQPWKGAK